MIVSLLIISVSAHSSSTFIITVQTSKQSYSIDESIEIYGNLEYSGAPVSNNPVAIEVQNLNGDPVVTRSVQTDLYGAYNLTFKLASDAKLGAYAVYVSSSYKGETATDNTTFTLTNVCESTITIEGKDYTITAESNATIANAAATRTTLDFTISGPTGQTAYVNATLPIEFNRTEIKVFKENIELVPPPFPTIASNGTHYIIYLEVTLSTHNITIWYARTDIATTNIASAKTVVGQGYTASINATVQNQGDYTETFNVTVYANTTSIASQNVTLSSGNSTTITFMWNAIGFTRGNYTISAYALPVPGETHITDNTFADGWVIVAMVGDITGPDGWPDGDVDIRDVSAVARLFGVSSPDPRYNPNFDINDDGDIDIKDVSTVARHYGEHYP